MKLAHRLRRTAFAAAAGIVVLSSHAFSQEISDAHLKAARETINAVKATASYDMLLPAAAQILKQELIQQNPDLTDLIISTVDEKALALASRRADLEREAALVYARTYSEPELVAITAFYNSEAGKKLLSQGPIVAREVTRAADIWQRGIQRDLATEVGKHIAQVVDAQVKADQATGANTAPAPAPEGEEAAPQDEAPALQGLDAPVE
jgi:hypothetical protein